MDGPLNDFMKILLGYPNLQASSCAASSARADDDNSRVEEAGLDGDRQVIHSRHKMKLVEND